MSDEMANRIAARSALLDFYSDRAVSFSGLFLASLFGLLTMLTLVQSIKPIDNSFTILFVSLSFVPFLTFALIGYVALRKFCYYADIANEIEGGSGEKESLRDYAKMDELFGKIATRVEAHKNEWAVKKMKSITSNKSYFILAYSALIILLVAVVYIPRFLWP